jgi:cytochrome c
MSAAGSLLPLALVVAVMAVSAVPARAGGGDRELGQFLSSECVTCHLPSGQKVGGIPAIVGWPEESFIAVMHSYARKERDNQVMQTVAVKLSEEELAALAAYFGSLKPP